MTRVGRWAAAAVWCLVLPALPAAGADATWSGYTHAGLQARDAEDPEFVRVTAEAANLRSSPTTSAEALRQAYEDDPLQVIASRGGWLMVRDFEGQEGWIHARLTDGRSTVIVTVSVANVRSGPGTTHVVTHTAERGVAFRVTGTRGTWLRVAHSDGARGWIHRDLVWGDVSPAERDR